MSDQEQTAAPDVEAPPPIEVPPPSARDIAASAVAPPEPDQPTIEVRAVPSLLEQGDTEHFGVDDRLAASPLADWFPGVEWRPILVWLSGVCFQSEEPGEQEPITLIIEGQAAACERVRYTNSKPWTEGVIGWFGPEVTSPQQIGELIAEGAAPVPPSEAA